MATMTLPGALSAAAPRRRREAHQDGVRLLLLRLGGQSYCLPMAAVRTIERGDRLRRNPSGDRPLGWLRDTRDEVPVHSLASVLGRTSHVASGTVVVLPGRHGYWGLMVDEVERALDLPASRIQALPPVAQEGASRLFHGVAVLEGGELVLGLSLASLCPDNQPTLEASELDDAYWPVAAAAPGRTLTSAGDQSRRMLLFSASTREDEASSVTYGLSIRQVVEIVPTPTLIPVPNSPPCFLGLLPWRGQAVPAVDLALALGIPSALYERSPRLLVARTGDSQALVAVPMSVGAGSVELPLPESLGPGRLPLRRVLARGVFDVKGDTLVIPDLDAMLLMVM